MRKDLKGTYNILVYIVERLLAVIVLGGVLAMALFSVPVLIDMNWSQPVTFYELIYRVLLAVIGLELIRMLITHDLIAVLELLAFVVARKMLKPDLTAIDIALGVGAFVVLVLLHKILTNKTSKGKISEELKL